MAPIPSLNRMKKLIQLLKERMIRAALTMEEKPPPSRPVTRSLLATTAFAFLGGMLFFLTVKLLPSQPTFWHSYYIWDKAEDCLQWLVILVVCKPFRRFLLFPFTYSIIRLFWQIYTTLTGEGINNHWWITLIWLILVSYFIFQSVREMIREWHQD